MAKVDFWISKYYRCRLQAKVFKTDKWLCIQQRVSDNYAVSDVCISACIPNLPSMQVDALRNSMAGDPNVEKKVSYCACTHYVNKSKAVIVSEKYHLW